MTEYNIESIASYVYVHVAILKGMYGLKKTSIIAFKRLVKKSAPHGHHPFTFTPGM